MDNSTFCVSIVKYISGYIIDYYGYSDMHIIYILIAWVSIGTFVRPKYSYTGQILEHCGASLS